MKSKIYLLTTFFAVAMLVYGFVGNSAPKKDKHPDVDWTIGCAECHEEMTPEVFKDWKESKHGDMNFGCYICHGDGQETFTRKAKTTSVWDVMLPKRSISRNRLQRLVSRVIKDTH